MRARSAVVTGALILAVAQLGRLPAPQAYLRHEDTAYHQALARCARSAQDADVLVMGNSRMMMGIDVPDLAREVRLAKGDRRRARVVSLAAPGATAAGELWLWRQVRHAPHLRRVRLAIVGISPIDFTWKSPGNDGALKHWYRVSDVPWLVREGQIDQAARLLAYRLLPLYALRESVDAVIWRKPKPESLLPPPSSLMDAWWLYKYRGWYAGYDIDRFQRHCLELLVSEMKTDRIRVVLVCAPAKTSLLQVEGGLAARAPVPPGPRWTGRPGSPLRQFNAMARAIARRSGVRYLNYARPFYTDRLSWHDPAHLTPVGAMKFTCILAEDVNASAPAATLRPSEPRRKS